ncbi:response regulator mcs4 [Cladorrhinum sp. PSN332]|nr:response regulator mcs4 [Cladorrhinum sp. PSN332]
MREHASKAVGYSHGLGQREKVLSFANGQMERSVINSEKLLVAQRLQELHEFAEPSMSPLDKVFSTSFPCLGLPCPGSAKNLEASTGSRRGTRGTRVSWTDERPWNAARWLMGDLKSKLRAKFPRRQSGGILSLSSAKSNRSTKSVSSSKSDGGHDGEPECLANGVVAPGAEKATTEGGAPACSSAATDSGGRELDPTRALGHTANHQAEDRDTGTTTDVTVSDAEKNCRFETSHPGDPRGSNGLINSEDPANATTTLDSSSQSNNEPPQPQPHKPMAPSSDGAHDLNGIDRRFSTASRHSALQSINEIAAADGKQDRDTDNNDTALRRIRLQDTPVNNLDGPQLRSSNSISNSTARPTAPLRRQSLLPSRQTTLIRTLLNAAQADELDPAAVESLLPIHATMVTRKIWVKRLGGSPTLVTINEEDLVDDVRDMILRKYSNSLGRQFDAPDLVLKIIPREQQRQDRILGPEEPMARTLDAYFPGGQTVEEALLIDVPQRRLSPRSSPRSGPPHAQHLTSVVWGEDVRPTETGTDYFGPGAVANVPVTVAGPNANGTTQAPHSISVLSTGQIPQIPSPGGTRGKNYRDRPERPRLGRQHTSSPTILNVIGAGGHTTTIALAPAATAASAASIPTVAPVGAPAAVPASAQGVSDQPNGGQLIPGPPSAPASTVGVGPAASMPPLPTTPGSEVAPAAPAASARVSTPPARTASPRLSAMAKSKKKKTDGPALPAGMLSGGVPPINVLIVEDNIINLRLLEAFIKRLKVRWATAMNGREAVTKWRNGGFHLVLMDIQLPIMNGLDATREIRRLERINSIGAFSAAGKGKSEIDDREETEDDILANRERFKSPVIIVALTASSLQSDRHEALAAGCNDFLTKPVTYVWLERKVMEWGCMQALIDFDGWRKWKTYTDDDTAKKSKAKKERAAIANGSTASTSSAMTTKVH